MVSLPHRKRRREQLLDALKSPLLLMAGGMKSRNYPQNVFPFRADSTFLFFFADPEPDAAALFDPADHSVTLFVHQRTAENALWHGPEPSFAAMEERHGVTSVQPLEKLKQLVKRKAKGRRVDTVAVADQKATALAAEITGQRLDHDRTDRQGAGGVVDAIGRLRLLKDEEEVAEMRATAVVTNEAHVAAMRSTRPGVSEDVLTGVVEGTFARHGCVPAYNTILSVRGEILHNNKHDQTVGEGDMVLLDAGAESHSGYCSDVTRCWPGGGRFSPEGRTVYELVLRAEKAAIDAVRGGVRYRDVHMLACRVIAEGLVDMKLLHGKADVLVEKGAHAMFFPHGVGHLLGLDVHDMEAFGDRIGYSKGRKRSKQFGLAYLRMDLDLQPGMTFTIEPGIYFVPAILRNDEFRRKFKGDVDFDRAERFLTMNKGRGFGGVRIEDDVRATEDGCEVITEAIPKEAGEVEALVGSAK